MLSEHVINHIKIIRGRKVILDSDLAALYGVPTKRLNEQVKRNLDRFPGDFMFQLTEIEAESLRSQLATSNASRGGRRFLPYAFTEHGTLMAANVLNNAVAIAVSIEIVRTFIQLRQTLWIKATKVLTFCTREQSREFGASPWGSLFNSASCGIDGSSGGGCGRRRLRRRLRR